MGLQTFLSAHPVFTHEEFAAFLNKGKARSVKTRESLLAYHQKQGRILRVRRGLYCVVPPGSDPTTCPVDAYLLASKMTDDAVLAYHTALEFHGKAYSIFEEIQYLTGRAARPVTFRSQRFRPVRFPTKLAASANPLFAVKEVDRAGLAVRVTSLERTLVDVLDRPDLDYRHCQVSDGISPRRTPRQAESAFNLRHFAATVQARSRSHQTSHQSQAPSQQDP